MARITSLNMLLESTGKDYLAELYGKVIENVQGKLISAQLKNTDLSGNPEAGSVEAKRMANAQSATYGAARTATKGTGVTVRPVTISLDQNKEIVEELEDKDVQFYGVDGVLEKRAANHQMAMVRELERAFFAEAVSAGTAYTPSSGITATEDKIEEAIQKVETTNNAFVDGCPRDMIAVICNPAVYGEIRKYVDALPSANVNSGAGEIGLFHGCEIHSSTYLPSTTKFIVMAKGSIAQPVYAKGYSAEKIPLSNAFGVELFYDYGTKAVAPDLIVKA